ncbi:type III-B CRISPR module RAMP protein Cmr6 [Vibrio cincinnatiensis]|uniref:type III-B CRISPR module RAMP protein Cmr6 n=1 Tax=Vibrio cincinnatiensis TaxID=675 RepID=UPI001EDD9D67|nr:type III-B CRISPR module RAMP protein Cmr6 [Vibrio cincinnatiensis]MCG3733757.1 type III-B CRISPR module RAMP protein Cmr6 [Vibrio cincinnatiensis]MCG3740932.1 type III-B CRISPR module RAMP protein Cmr6 [Vibrio cincinnatiensis]
MPLPLYHSIGEHAQRQITHTEAHQGLWFERFFDKYDEDYQVKDKPNSTAIKDNPKSQFIQGITGNCGNKEALQQSYFRQSALLAACKGRSVTLQAEWHFATGLGNPHPVENGFLFHPTLAAPYLPGSSVKGLVRSWLEQQLGTDLEAKALFYRLFGSEDKDPTKCELDFNSGDVIFFDALPVMPASLVLDIMTPHLGGWYEKGGTKDASEAANQPADWHDPVPVPFLAAQDVVLMFSFAPRKGSDDQDLLMQLVEKALKDALYYAGAGAKTAAGYGGFKPLDDKKKRQLNDMQQKGEQAGLSEEQKLLATIAGFLTRSTELINKTTRKKLATAIRQLKKDWRDWPEADQIKANQFILEKLIPFVDSEDCPEGIKDEILKVQKTL